MESGLYSLPQNGIISAASLTLSPSFCPGRELEYKRMRLPVLLV